MSLKVAFIGLRHGHGLGMYKHMLGHPDIEIVGVCEEDSATRESLAAQGIAVTHTSYSDLLGGVECDAVATADYYGIRGERLIAALERGCHAIADKPLCTRTSELVRIRALAREKNLKVGCMLDVPGSGRMVTLKRMFDAGRIGEVHAIDFCGQHPLLYGSRPAWYFEDGKHGGTINDIAIHAIDAIPWLTGRRFAEATAARVWNAGPPSHPRFQTGAMMMLRMDNDAGVLGDVSYLTSDKLGYQMPSYWRMTFYGTQGTVETSAGDTAVRFWGRQADAVVEEPLDPGDSQAYLKDFLADIAGRPIPGGLETARVLESSRVALRIQEAADAGEFAVSLGE